MNKKFWIFLVIATFLVYVFRTPLSQVWQSIISGGTAVADASAAKYTTYNQSLYNPPFWQPILTFFKANSYAPSVTSAQNGSGAAAYSVQG